MLCNKISTVQTNPISMVVSSHGMAPNDTQIVQDMFNDLAANYDDLEAVKAVGHALISDFLVFASIKEGQDVLDLCCGTGYLTFDLKLAVGDQGHVAGVDFSERMLAKACQRNDDIRADIKFYNHNVMDLHHAKLEPASGKTPHFNHIVCCESLMYLDTQNALEHWQEFLVSGGYIVADVWADQAQVGIQVMAQVAKDLGVPLPWTAGWANSSSAVVEVWENAGLVDVEVFESNPYLVEKFDGDARERLFERVWHHTLETPLRDVYPKEMAREIFFGELENLARDDGDVVQEIRTYIAKGKKV